MIFISKLKYNDKEVTLSINNYEYDKMCMALSLNDKKGNLYKVITVNFGNDIGNDSFMQKNCAFVDVNNNPDVENFIIENKLGESYMRFGDPVIMQSGFCEYPLYKFNEEKLKELDQAGYYDYEKEYQNEYLKIMKEKEAEFIL